MEYIVTEKAKLAGGENMEICPTRNGAPTGPYTVGQKFLVDAEDKAQVGEAALWEAAGLIKKVKAK